MSEVANIPQLRFPGFSDEWEERPLKDVSTFFNGKAYKQAELLSSGKYPVLRVGNFFTNNSWYYSNLELDENKYCDNGDLLYAWSASFGPRIWAGEKVIYHYHIWKVINHSQVTKKFLFIVLDNETAKMKAQSANGFALLHITKGTIENWKINLPTRQEQQKIAAFLTAVDSKIEKLSKKKALLGEYKKGLMQQIFSQAIRFKADDGSAFPVWEEKNIVELAKTSIGLVTSMTPYYVDKGVPLIRNNDIFQNKIRKEKLIRLDYEFDQLNKNRRLFTNDIVTVHTGNIGASAVIDEELNGCQGFATLNTRIKNQNEISSSFLCWYYNSTRNIKYALSMATGDGRSNYNLKDFNKATIPVPSLPEQTKIAAFLTAADNKIEQVGKQLDESKQFKKALLQQMFV